MIGFHISYTWVRQCEPCLHNNRWISFVYMTNINCYIKNLFCFSERWKNYTLSHIYAVYYMAVRVHNNINVNKSVQHRHYICFHEKWNKIIIFFLHFCHVKQSLHIPIPHTATHTHPTCIIICIVCMGEGKLCWVCVIWPVHRGFVFRLFLQYTVKSVLFKFWPDTLHKITNVSHSSGDLIQHSFTI